MSPAPPFAVNQPAAQPAAHSSAESFVDRRLPQDLADLSQSPPALATERRQFANSHNELSPGARELALAIDEYKLLNRRRFITFEEMHNIIQSLGYSKD